MEQQVIHARYKNIANETLCGKTGVSLDGWSGETAGEITCPDCEAKIHRFTPEELSAAVDPALRQLEQQSL